MWQWNQSISHSIHQISIVFIAGKDGSIETTKKNFAALQSMVEKECKERDDWTLDEENLEGIRVRMGTGGGGGFFVMLRVSLHDPIISLQVEARSTLRSKKCCQAG